MDCKKLMADLTDPDKVAAKPETHSDAWCQGTERPNQFALVSCD